MTICAHHDHANKLFYDPSQPCTDTPTIAKDPHFRISTALLYIRAAEAKSLSENSNAPHDSIESQPSLERVNSYIDPSQCKTDGPTGVDYSKPDLGLLHLHRDRLAAAGDAIAWRKVPCLARNSLGLAELEAAIDKHVSTLNPVAQAFELRKLRILVGKQNQIDVDSFVIGELPPKAGLPAYLPQSFDLTVHALQNPCKVYLDIEATKPSTLTSHKSIHRCLYDAARRRHHIEHSSPLDEEVILYNELGEVMEASLCTVYFFREGRWITPAMICGPHVGVTRRLAIEHGLASQGTVDFNEVATNEPVWLSNAVRGFFPGRITVCKDKPRDTKE